MLLIMCHKHVYGFIFFLFHLDPLKVPFVCVCTCIIHKSFQEASRSFNAFGFDTYSIFDETKFNTKLPAVLAPKATMESWTFINELPSSSKKNKFFALFRSFLLVQSSSKEEKVKIKRKNWFKLYFHDGGGLTASPNTKTRFHTYDRLLYTKKNKIIVYSK